MSPLPSQGAPTPAAGGATPPNCDRSPSDASADRLRRRGPRRRFLIPWLIGAVLIGHVALWAAWFALAARHPVAEVPLATGRP